jgi:hypothetical protein
LRRLTRAENEGNAEQMIQIVASLIKKLMERGRYGLASHWAEWSMHLHESCRATQTATYSASVREWALAKLVLGQTDDLERLWGKGLSRIPVSLAATQWSLGGLGSLITLRRGNLLAAVARCRDLWQRARQRRHLLDLANAYVQVLIRLGNHGHAHAIAERVTALTAGGPRAERSRSLLVTGIAFSRKDPDRSCAALEECRRGLTGPWRAQASLYLAETYRAADQNARGEGVLEQNAAVLREISPAGLSLLVSAARRPESLLCEPRRDRLELRFLGGVQARYRARARELRLRFGEFLAVLASHPEGLSAEQLALAVYGESGSPASCKTEVSRLKRIVPLDNRPYRLAVPVWADFVELPLLIRRGALREAIELYRGPLLPRSDAPDIRDLRITLEESLRAAVLAAPNVDLLWSLASRIREDLELWEALYERLPVADPRRALAQAQVSSLQRAWSS